MVVSIDEPVYGKHWANLSAVPASREIIKRMLIKYDEIHRKIIKKSEIEEENNQIIKSSILSNHSKVNKNIFPDFRGKTLKEAIKIAQRMNITLEPHGISGKIISQSIKPGSKIKNKMNCIIKIKI